MKRTSPSLRVRLSVEAGAGSLLDEPAADLLEQIRATGSLTKAAATLRYSYRRAWMMLDRMNKRWPTPLVTTATGGKRGGGATLTPAGENALTIYRDLQLHLEHWAGTHADAFRDVR